MPKKRQQPTEIKEYIIESNEKPEKSKYSTKPLTKKIKKSKEERMEEKVVFC